MTNKLSVGIAGATGLVGSEIVQILKERKFTGDVRLFGSDDSSGEVYDLGEGSEAIVETLSESAIKELDFLMFVAGRTMAEKFIPIAQAAGVIVIDASGFVQEASQAPVVVPEVNSNALKEIKQLVATPTGIAALSAELLGAVQRVAGLRHVFISTYQGVSSAGKYALDELWDQIVAVCNQRDINVEHLPAQIAFNCVPEVDGIVEGGETREETRTKSHLRSMLGLPTLGIDITAVRVPMLHGVGIAVTVLPERDISVEAFCQELANHPRYQLADPVSSYRVPLEAVGQDEIFVGRVRNGDGAPRSLSWWMSGDNLRKGSALNMVEILYQLAPMKQ